MESASTSPDYAVSQCAYTSCYCEENVYLLVNRFLKQPGSEREWDAFVVFISNPTRTVALWNQRMGSSADTAVVWDYHVVLALRGRQPVGSRSPINHLNSGQGTWIYDLDTRLPVPCYWKAYVDETFPLCAGTPPQYQRVIPGDVYLDNFASDRSHMLDDSWSSASEVPRYLSKPPPYPAIRGPEAEKRGVMHNLMTHFVSMAGDEQGFGAVMDFEGFTTCCHGSMNDAFWLVRDLQLVRSESGIVGQLVMSSASSTSCISLNGHTRTNGLTPPALHPSENSYGDDANVSVVSPLPVSNGYSHAPYHLHNEEIVNHLYHAGFQTGNYADTILHVHQNSYRLHAIILSRSPFLAHLMSTSPQASGQRVVYVELNHEPEVTHEGIAIALGYLYSPISISLIRPENARGVLAAGCLLGGMEDLCGYAYGVCRQSISVETVTEWLDFINNIPVSSDGSFSPQPPLTSVFGQYARKLRDDVFHFLVVTLPNTLELYSSAGSESDSSPGHPGRETLLQIFSVVPFDMFKAAVESPTFQIGSDQCRFKFAKDAIELRKRGIARGHGSEETVVLAFGGGHMSGSAVHITRKMRKRPLWKVNS